MSAVLTKAAIRARVEQEARGRCTRCGEFGDRLVAGRLAFELLCKKCNAKRGVAVREENKAAMARQCCLFGEPSK